MSSTTGAQNLLVNVFRPVYAYAVPPGGTTAVFIPKIEITNVDTVSANSISVFTAAVGDANFNVYVGSNAGNAYDFLNACRNVTALGYNAGNTISNVSNSVYIGFNAGTGASTASNVIAIGANALGNGSSNIYIGSGTGAAGSNNIFIGHGIAPGTTSNTFRVGRLLYGDVCSGTLGVGRVPAYNLDVSGSGRISSRLGVGMAPDPQHGLDVSGYTYVYGGLGINADPQNFTLNLNGNFYASEGGDTFSFSSNADGIVQASAGYNSSNGNVTVSGGATTIGTLKRGIIMVSAVDSANSANNASRLLFAYTTSNVTNLGSDISAGRTSITLSSSNIRITDTSTTSQLYSYSITYFPLS
jgi:hypothetical protein